MAFNMIKTMEALKADGIIEDFAVLPEGDTSRTASDDLPSLTPELDALKDASDETLRAIVRDADALGVVTPTTVRAAQYLAERDLLTGVAQDATGWYFAVDGTIIGDSFDTEAEAREALADYTAPVEDEGCGSPIGCGPQGCPACNEAMAPLSRRRDYWSLPASP